MKPYYLLILFLLFSSLSVSAKNNTKPSFVINIKGNRGTLNGVLPADEYKAYLQQKFPKMYFENIHLDEFNDLVEKEIREELLLHINKKMLEILDKISFKSDANFLYFSVPIRNFRLPLQQVEVNTSTFFPKENMLFSITNNGRTLKMNISASNHFNGIILFPQKLNVASKKTALYSSRILMLLVVLAILFFAAFLNKPSKSMLKEQDRMDEFSD